MVFPGASLGRPGAQHRHLLTGPGLETRRGRRPPSGTRSGTRSRTQVSYKKAVLFSTSGSMVTC